MGHWAIGIDQKHWTSLKLLSSGRWAQIWTNIYLWSPSNEFNFNAGLILFGSGAHVITRYPGYIFRMIYGKNFVTVSIFTWHEHNKLRRYIYTEHWAISTIRIDFAPFGIVQLIEKSLYSPLDLSIKFPSMNTKQFKTIWTQNLLLVSLIPYVFFIRKRKKIHKVTNCWENFILTHSGCLSFW